MIRIVSPGRAIVVAARMVVKAGVEHIGIPKDAAAPTPAGMHRPGEGGLPTEATNDGPAGVGTIRVAGTRTTTVRPARSGFV
jgi:hypothetical protein